MRRTTAVGAAGLALILVTGGCSGDDGDSGGGGGGDNTLTVWTLEDVTDLTTARDQIATFLGNMVDAANTAKREVKAAGSPSSPNGAKIEALFVSGLGASAKVFAKGEAAAAKLPTTSAEEFKVKGKELGADLSDGTATTAAAVETTAAAETTTAATGETTAAAAPP